MVVCIRGQYAISNGILSLKGGLTDIWICEICTTGAKPLSELALIKWLYDWKELANKSKSTVSFIQEKWFEIMIWKWLLFVSALMRYVNFNRNVQHQKPFRSATGWIFRRQTLTPLGITLNAKSCQPQGSSAIRFVSKCKIGVFLSWDFIRHFVHCMWVKRSSRWRK